MTIRYEVNPPKVVKDTILSHEELQKSVNVLRQRISDISNFCQGIHITDSVLGVPRISPFTTGSQLRKVDSEIKITASVRVRDRNLTSMTQSLCDSILLGINGVLFLKGDEPPKGPKDSGLIPSNVVKHFVELGFDKKIDMYLSLPSNPDFKKIQKKIDAQPKGFITQIISSVEQVSRISDELKPQGFDIIPIVMLPTEKNENAAKNMNLNWSSYKGDVTEFIKEIRGITGDVLITSPNDFKAAQQVLSQLS